MAAARLDSPLTAAGNGAASLVPRRRAGHGAFEIDHELRERLRPAVRFFFERYWRVRTRGLANVPRHGGAILVGNHSGALPVDAAMVAYAVDDPGNPDSPRRVARVLYDRFVDGMPWLADIYRRAGGVPARYSVAEELARRGELVVIFPEGIDGVAKLFDQRYRLQRFATSAARLSCRYRLPVIPFAVVGAEEAYPVIGRSAEAGRLVGAPYLPITPFFPLLGPLGMLPLPSRWTLVFGPRIYLFRERRFRDGRDFDAMTERLQRSVRLLLERAVRERQSVLLG
ncbi:MAG TPA: 1-acyl-sn-glycerol-3-phosphate acyltransferase [Candidatus Limnocylindrales bacterium]|nr:1-acyl-sn-glycerol-3-phosphate acyltransferase [Candidatus Limnocylindrales bacterium]